LGLGLAYQKQRLGPKLAGVWAMETSKNCDPQLILATVEGSNYTFAIQLWFGLAYQKQRLGPKLAGGGAELGKHPTKFGTPTYFFNR